MVKPFLILAATLVTAACAERYKQPIALAPHGDAVRANMAAQIIDPRPPRPHPLVTASDRPVLAVGAYNADQVKDPTQQSTAPVTTNVD